MRDTDPDVRSLSSSAETVQHELQRLDDGMLGLRHQVQRLQKLASMGTMSAVLAHEFNNLLTPMISYSQHALQGRDPQRMASALEKTLRHARRAATLCDKILGMAADEPLGAAAAPLLPIVSDAMECLVRDLEKDNIDVEIDVPPDLSARVRTAGLQQVLFNLILNARQAMLGRHGRLTIRGERLRDGRVALVVADSGPGIPAEALARIFDPFFSTKSRSDKPDRRGLGLGLTISKQLIEESDGELTVESRAGEGATFRITLPGGSER